MKVPYMFGFMVQMIHFTVTGVLLENKGLESEKYEKLNNQENGQVCNQKTVNNNKDGFLSRVYKIIQKDLILSRVKRDPKQSRKKQKQIRKELMKQGLPPRSTPTPKYLYKFHEDHLIHLPFPMVWWRKPVKLNSFMARTMTCPAASTLNKSVITYFTIKIRRKPKFFDKGRAGGGRRFN